MREEKKNAYIHVKAIAGTHVVLLAINPLQSNLDNLRGFAIKRAADGKPATWLQGTKYFAKSVTNRDAINRGSVAGQKPHWLELDTTRAWIDSNFKAGSYKNNRLLTFFPDAAGACSWSANALKDGDPFKDETARAAAARASKNAAAKKRKATKKNGNGG